MQNLEEDNAQQEQGIIHNYLSWAELHILLRNTYLY